MEKPYKIIFYDGPQPGMTGEDPVLSNDSRTQENTSPAETGNTPPAYATKQEIEEILENKINNLRVYVLESDITEAQNSVRSIVEQASF